MLHDRSRRAPRLRTPFSAAALALILLLPARPGFAQLQPTAEQLDAQARQIKVTQRHVLMAGPLRHIRHNREYTEAYLKAMRKHKPAPPRGARARKSPPDAEPAPFPVTTGRLAAQQALAAPTNVLVNNPATDAAGVGQCEQSIATLGLYGLTAWNDGQGFITGPDVQGYGYTLDGGATWTDGGMVPRSDPNAAWTSDPVVTVNEKTGEFWYCGLYDSIPTVYSGVAIEKATFSPSGISWGAVHIADMQNSNFFIDKQWMVADSASGYLYLTYTKFTASDDSIMFTRSADGGVTWSHPIVLSDPATAGNQQGSRAVVGPGGEVYVVWAEIGPISNDFIMIRKSTDHGVTWGPQVTAASPYNNFGTGAPGFNRERSVDFPAIAVDRTVGPNRGRVYLAWHEAVNWYFDALGTGGAKNEVEPNNLANTTATPFTPGQILRGTFSSTSDVDYFSFDATQGTTYVFAVDSIPRPLYTARIYCTDGVTKLEYTGLLSTPVGYASYMVFTAPAAGKYYLRMFYYANGGSVGGYRIKTGVHAPGSTVGRDQRDVVVSYSDGGSAWSTPQRACDDPAWFDDWLPEVSVGADGTPYVMWFDWRESTTDCAGSSQIHIARSTDGGATWWPSQKVTTAASPWSSVSTNIAPNQGDYNAIYSDARYVRPAWSDGRGGTPDVYTAAIDTWFTMSGCGADTTLHPQDVVVVSPTVTNDNPLFENEYSGYILTDRHWPITPAGISIPAASSQAAPVSLTVPDTAATGVVRATLCVTNSKGTLLRTCGFNLTVIPTAGVGSEALAFGLHQNTPNPVHGAGTRIEYALPREGAVRLEIFGLHGERVRTLVDGVRTSGLHSATWDGRDDRGNTVRAGTYFYRLTGLGHTAVRRLVLLP